MTMTQKMKISKSIADAIDLFLNNVISRSMEKEQAQAALVAEHYNRDWTKYEDGQYSALNDISTSDLMKCMTVGYESENVEEENRPKYLKVWEGVTSGSFAGRNDGYPETKYTVYNSLEDLSRHFGKCKNERYYKLERVGNSELEKVVKEVQEEMAIKKEEQKKLQIEKEMEKLKKELDTLENPEKRIKMFNQKS